MYKTILKPFLILLSGQTRITRKLDPGNAPHTDIYPLWATLLVSAATRALGALTLVSPLTSTQEHGDLEPALIVGELLATDTSKYVKKDTVANSSMFSSIVLSNY